MHTQGPWHSQGCQIVRQGHPPGEDADRNYLVVDLKPGRGESIHQTEINARLIAAAPDMAKALLEVLDYFAAPDGGNPEHTEATVRAVLAKAGIQ